MIKPKLTVCTSRKRIFLSRSVITLLGNPSHLSFWYDESEKRLYVSAAEKDELDAYEIPKHYWSVSSTSKKDSCMIVRRAFFEALQFRTGWEDKSKFKYTGSADDMNGVPIIVFDLTKGLKVR
jgi:Ni,Fe-hydrogenase I small subunit